MKKEPAKTQGLSDVAAAIYDTATICGLISKLELGLAPPNLLLENLWRHGGTLEGVKADGRRGLLVVRHCRLSYHRHRAFLVLRTCNRCRLSSNRVSVLCCALESILSASCVLDGNP